MCSVAGKCYEGCEDGKCYEEVKNGDDKLDVPAGCNPWMQKCANECANDPKCAAFSFRYFFDQI